MNITQRTCAEHRFSTHDGEVAAWLVVSGRALAAHAPCAEIPLTAPSQP